LKNGLNTCKPKPAPSQDFHKPL
jgi:hypothetical protein